MYSQDLCKKLYILTEVFVRYRYSPDVTHCVFFFSLTIVPFWDRIFKACLHLQFQHECTKYAYILVQQGEVYTTGGLVLKFILFCSPEVYRVVLPQSIALTLSLFSNQEQLMMSSSVNDASLLFYLFSCDFESFTTKSYSVFDFPL